MPELCSLKSVCGQACVYRHIVRCVFITIFINHKYSCSGGFNFILLSQAPYEDIQEEDCPMSPAGQRVRRNRGMSLLFNHLCAMRYLMYQPAIPDTASHASTRRQARTDGGGGEKESSVPQLCSLESVCGQACAYRHIARCVLKGHSGFIFDAEFSMPRRR